MIGHPATLQELSNEYAKKQPHQVNYLLEETPILAGIKFEVASHALWNVAEKVTGIEGADFVPMNSPLPEMNVDSGLEQVDLNIMGGEIFVPQDKAQAYGGKEKYIAKRMPVLLKDAGNRTEKRIIYGNYRKYALDNGKVQSATGVAGDELFSMIIVRSVAGENGGLYSPEGFKQGAMLDVQPLYNGGLMKDSRGVAGYGVQVKGYFGMQILNPKTMSAIVNIAPDKLPTVRQISKALSDARANPANTKILMHPLLLGYLGDEYKKEMLRVTNNDKGINTQIVSWNEIPVLSSYNFMEGTEGFETI